ncbi:unannotated protein [freshwater metagenome]|uniref:Unannotated protein n=1 Tax=freshwater metagenome TaxID=449393 RepID=A0A6J7D4R1_9ZZZZ|nr:hypothetical protein [Actinomycetota bacterium]
MTSGETWTLRRDREVLGTIEIRGGDFPWLSGEWVPTVWFDDVRALFERELELVEGPEFDGKIDDWEDAYREIWRQGVRLHRPEGTAVPEFLLHIRGDEAWFRWSDEAFESGGVADS